jgi:hypothetical protein
MRPSHGPLRRRRARAPGCGIAWRIVICSALLRMSVRRRAAAPRHDAGRTATTRLVVTKCDARIRKDKRPVSERPQATRPPAGHPPGGWSARQDDDALMITGAAPDAKGPRSQTDSPWRRVDRRSKGRPDLVVCRFSFRSRAKVRSSILRIFPGRCHSWRPVVDDKAEAPRTPRTW